MVLYLFVDYSSIAILVVLFVIFIVVLVEEAHV